MSIRVGVIGAGLMGTTHVRTLSASVPAAEVVAVSDAIAASATRVAREAGVEAIYTDALELIGDPDVDAGKPVLCEKPLAASAADARRVVEAEVALGRRLVQVGFMRRFDPAYAEMKTKLDRGDVGAPVLVHCAHRNPTVPPGFGSEKILTDSTVHDIDTARWLLQQEIVKVTVLTPRPTRHAPKGVHDPLLVIFETDAGALVDVEAFVNAQYGYDIRCEIVGESGTVALPPPGHEIATGFQERFASAYVNELRGWVASIATGEVAGAGAWDGYAATVVCEAAVESLRTGKPTEIHLAQGVIA